MKKYSIIVLLSLILVSSCSLFEDDNNDINIIGDLYLSTIFQGVVYDEENKLMLNTHVQIDLLSEKDGEPKSRSTTYTDDFGGFTSVFKFGTTREEWYYRLYIKPPRELEPKLAAEGPVELGSLVNLEIKLAE
jgi:hypothetical protein